LNATTGRSKSPSAEPRTSGDPGQRGKAKQGGRRKRIRRAPSRQRPGAGRGMSSRAVDDGARGESAQLSPPPAGAVGLSVRRRRRLWAGAPLAASPCGAPSFQFVRPSQPGTERWVGDDPRRPSRGRPPRRRIGARRMTHPRHPLAGVDALVGPPRRRACSRCLAKDPVGPRGAYFVPKARAHSGPARMKAGARSRDTTRAAHPPPGRAFSNALRRTRGWAARTRPLVTRMIRHA